MRIETLIESVHPTRVLHEQPGLELGHICTDSRKVQKGDLFVALPGTKGDGADFAPDAMSLGASAIMTENEEPLTRLPQIVVKSARVALAQAARAYHAWPDRRLRIGGVTGTNGKSTTAYLVRHLLNEENSTCGMLGTIEYDLGGDVIPAPLTTPDSLDLYAHLRVMASNRCHAAIMEVSSHALSQSRVEGIDFLAAGFTNLTQDHLDYHRTMEAYREAKAILFRNLSPRATAVINLDDPTGEYYAKETRAQVLGFTLKNNPAAEFKAEITAMDIHGTTFRIRSPWGSREVHWKHVGAHNVQNAMTGLGMSLALGGGHMHTFNFDRALRALENFKGVPGRLEPVADGRIPFRVLVDYAHTEDALRNVMGSLRKLNPSRLIVLFGCGGDRDRTKRAKMARAVEEMADLGVITSDNPRTEDPRGIIADIWTGVTRQSKFIVEQDRSKAIEMALREGRPGDVVLLAGKGHEDYQIVGTTKLPFDDRLEAISCLEKRFSQMSTPVDLRAAG